MVSWACGSWSSHAHPLASCFFSLALLVSLNSFVYLRERHISWGFSALGAFEGSCSESWSLGLAVLEPHAHAFVWYFFSLVWLVSLVVISLVVISLVVLCLQQSNVNMMHIKRGQPKATCMHARATRASRALRQTGRARARDCQSRDLCAGSKHANIQATLHVYVCM